MTRISSQPNPLQRHSFGFCYDNGIRIAFLFTGFSTTGSCYPARSSLHLQGVKWFFSHPILASQDKSPMVVTRTDRRNFCLTKSQDENCFMSIFRNTLSSHKEPVCNSQFTHFPQLFTHQHAIFETSYLVIGACKLETKMCKLKFRPSTII